MTEKEIMQDTLFGALEVDIHVPDNLKPPRMKEWTAIFEKIATIHRLQCGGL